MFYPQFTSSRHSNQKQLRYLRYIHMKCPSVLSLYVYISAISVHLFQINGAALRSQDIQLRCSKLVPGVEDINIHCISPWIDR